MKARAPSFGRKLRQIRYFLSRGPAYHIAWAKWRAARLHQNILRPNYDAQLEDDGLAGRFFFDAAQVPAIVAKISAPERQATIDHADAVCRRSFTFRGREPVQFAGAIDWHFAPDDNKDWRWDLNRHGWFESLGRAWHYTGNADYALTFEAQLLDWLAKNPPAVDSVNWSSAFEVGFRINSWSWAYHLFAGCEAVSQTTRAALLQGIGRHAEFLYRNLEINARNNHLLLECKALFFAAILFPGFRNASAWRKRAAALLLREIRAQVLADGVHAEMSTHYHRVIAGELLELLLLCRLNDIALPDDVIDRIRAMADVECCVTRPDGSLPLIGDSAADDTYARFSARLAGSFVFGLDVARYESPALDEACQWRLAAIPLSPPTRLATASRAFPDGGLYVMRCGDTIDSAMHAVVNCGPFGLPADPHHGHADALSVELFAAGRPWIVDSGVYSTHADWRWRRYFRGTRGHNTVLVDDTDQALLIDSRRAAHLPTATCTAWTTDDIEDHFDGRHDGYARLGDGIGHRRIVRFVRGRCWLIVDLVSGAGRHTVETLYHCPDDVDIALGEGGAATLTADGTSTLRSRWTASRRLDARVAHGETDPVQGWYSTQSGEKRPAPALVIYGDVQLPLIVAAAFVPSSSAANGAAPRLLLEDNAVTLTLDDAHVSIALPPEYFTTL